MATSSKRLRSKASARKTSKHARKNSASKSTSVDLADSIVGAWNTSNRVTIFLLNGLPAELWDAKIPGEPRRSIRMLAAHLHNCRVSWLRTLGAPHGLRVPKPVDRHKVKPQELTAALKLSGADMAAVAEIWLRERRNHSADTQICMAQLAARRRPRTRVFRGARRPSSRPNRHAGAAAGPPAAGRNHRRNVALGQAFEGTLTRFRRGAGCAERREH